MVARAGKLYGLTQALGLTTLVASAVAYGALLPGATAAVMVALVAVAARRTRSAREKVTHSSRNQAVLFRDACLPAASST
jgi:glutamate/tyrosine decarboxylase-like PLP-dependent enzyme